MGKYGDGGDRLLFKILNNGDYLQGVSDDLIERKDSQGLIRQISKRGLRYDLTVPFARFIVMNRQNIKFPFKRSAIQPGGELTSHKKVVIRSFINAMLM